MTYRERAVIVLWHKYKWTKKSISKIAGKSLKWVESVLNKFKGEAK